MCRDISERVATQQNLEIFKRVLDKVSDSILAVSVDDLVSNPAVMRNME